MSLKQYVWNCIYEKNRITRSRHQDNIIFGNSYGLFGRIKEIGSLNVLNIKASAKTKFPEYKPLYDKDFYKQKILNNDVISFDIFDTLLLRPFSRPTDLFYLLEHQNGIPNFRELRIRAEQYARRTTLKQNGEVNIYDIYEVLHKWCDIKAKDGVEQEIELESQLCFVHPFGYELYQFAVEYHKEIIVTSDMYIPSERLRAILEKKGYKNLSKVFVSCDFGVSKYSGGLSRKIKAEYSEKKILHIGDNKRSDYRMWKRYANDILLLRNVNESGMKNRLYAGLTIQGSIYAGIVNSHLYNGINSESKSPYYEYGYVYGGILTLGFCQWLHHILQKEEIEKTLFLARDCKIIKEIYDEEYSNENTSYFLTSRTALLPILCELFFDVFIDEAFKLRLINEKMTVRQAFKDLDLESVLDVITISQKDLDSQIMQKEWDIFKEKLYLAQKDIQKVYLIKYELLKEYIIQQIGNDKKLAIVDLGWRGSSILYLKYMIEKEYPEVTVIGAMFGTADYSMGRMRSCDSTIYSYLFSPEDSFYSEVAGVSMISAEERLYIEYMFTDVINSVIGYAHTEDGSVCDIRENKCIDNNNVMVNDMHNGIRGFVKDYNAHVGAIKDCLVLSKEITYMPLYRLLQNKKAMKRLFMKFKEKKSTVHGFVKE